MTGAQGKHREFSLNQSVATLKTDHAPPPPGPNLARGSGVDVTWSGWRHPPPSPDQT